MALPLPARGTLIFVLCHSRSLFTEKVCRDDQRTSCRESHTEVATNVHPLVHVYYGFQLIQSAAFFPFFLAALLIGDGFNPQAWAVKTAFDTTFNAIFTVIHSAIVGSTFLDKSDNLALAIFFPFYSSSLLSRWRLGFSASSSSDDKILRLFLCQQWTPSCLTWSFCHEERQDSCCRQSRMQFEKPSADKKAQPVVVALVTRQQPNQLC
jgi:hypothetical protein